MLKSGPALDGDMRSLRLLPVLFVFACTSTEPFERRIREQDAEISRLRSAQTQLETELKAQAKTSQERSAALDLARSSFANLEKPGKLKLRMAEGRIVIVLPTDILFETGKADLSENGEKELTGVAEACAELKDMRFQVEGHTDNVPIGPGIEFGDNWELGSARAISVVSIMIARGVDPSRVSAASFADSRPLKSNDTDEGRAANRRIEIIIVPDLSQVPQLQFIPRQTQTGPLPPP